MTRKQALCGIVSRYPHIAFDDVKLSQTSRLVSRRHLVEHWYVLLGGGTIGSGATIQAAFDDLCAELKRK